jgi:two-component system, sensor histidine kinase YesM
MRVIWHWLTSSLRRKLTFIMLISTLVPLLTLGAFTYSISSKITEEKIKQSGISTLKQMEGNLRFIVSDVENISISLIGQLDIQAFLSHPDENEILRSTIQGFMSNLVSSKSYISNITIYPHDTAAYLSTATIYQSEFLQKLDIFTIKDKRWTDLYQIHDYSGEHQVFSFIRPIRSIYNYNEQIGWLSISLDEAIISRYWSEPNLINGQGEITLMNEEGTILSSTVKAWLSSSIDTMFPDFMNAIQTFNQGDTVIGKGREKQTLLYYRQPSTGWILVGSIPYDLYRSENNYILQLTALAVVVTILINFGLITFVVQRVTNPLRVLTRWLTKVNPDGPMPVYQVNTSDEIGRLGESYNMLGMHIEQLKEQLILNETRKKEADIRALQAQINPHFLYNTLSSIHWMALMTEEKRIAEMVGALSDLLQFSLNKGNDYCPVHQEFAHIRNYVQIQSIRYPDKFDVNFVVDPELQDRLMLKLLLQPLLENAMIHGVQKKEGKGSIGVYQERRGNQMHFLVMDDGVGMTKQRLSDVRASITLIDNSFEQSISYGLRNVNERLRLHYGVHSCLQIESREGMGTRIAFTIPIMEVIQRA